MKRDPRRTRMAGGYDYTYDVYIYSGEGVVASVSNQPTTILHGGAGGRRPGAVIAVEYCHSEFIEALSNIILYMYTVYRVRDDINIIRHALCRKSIRLILRIFAHCPKYRTL